MSDIEKSIQNIQKEQESINFICDILTVILGYIEIDNFKKEKHIEYFELMKNMANLENDYN